MKKQLGFVVCLIAVVSFLVAGTAIAAADFATVATDKASIGLVVLAMILAGLLVALGVIRIMAGKMSTVSKQNSAKGYGQSPMLTEKSDVYLYSRTSSRQVQ